MYDKSSIDLISKPKLIKKGNLYLESLGGAITGISNLIPSSITGEKKLPEIEKPFFSMIERCNFGTLKHPNNKICLFLSFNNGIQIWDLSSSENAKDNSNFNQIFSLKYNNIRYIKFIPPPEFDDDEKSPFYQKRPLVILSSGSKFVIFSLKTNSEVEINAINHSNPILSIYANSTIILFCTKNKLYIYETNTFNPILQKDLFDSLDANKPPIAFGERWYAIPSPLMIPEIHTFDLEESKKDGHNGKNNSSNKNNNNGNNNSSLNSSSSSQSTLSYFTSTLYNWGDIGREKLQNYIYDQKEEKPTAGHVQIFDCKTNQNISHFKAHKHRLTHMVFDKSGTLLVTSSDGHNINVFRIVKSNSPYTSHEHIYALRRGFTNAKIHSIIFTDDSRWISVSSARGTNHIYPINLIGGQATERTHIFYSPLSSYDQTSNNSTNNSESALAVSSSCRIKQEVGTESNVFLFPLHASFFIRPSQSTLSSLSLNNNNNNSLGNSITSSMLGVNGNNVGNSASSVLSLLTFNPFGFITEHILTVKCVENALDVQYENFREWKFSHFEKKKNVVNFPEVNKVEVDISDHSNLFYQDHFLRIEKQKLEASLKNDKKSLKNGDFSHQQKDSDKENEKEKLSHEENNNPHENLDNKINNSKQKLKNINEKLNILAPILKVEKEKIWKSKIHVKTFSSHKDLIWSSRQFKFFNTEQITPQEKEFYTQSQKYYNLSNTNDNNASLINASFLDSFSEFKVSNNNNNKLKEDSPRLIDDEVFNHIPQDKSDKDDD
eukprot:TRINITY_DN5565_c1_g1_i1.p1 TRINITY_DN5565_c1_g1~~TRINITY_DN5565_c1_g1_i1.p1  ORF type:complete len:777 (+),score=263.92 TRINITY_DN5565_c1_g1_i1:91-2421(+)